MTKQHATLIDRKIPGSWWAKSALAGLIGGLAMGMYEMMVMALLGMGFFMPLNMIGATVPAFRPPGPAFAFGPTMAGLMLHMMTSLAWGLLYGAVATAIPRLARSWSGEAVLGMVWGVAAWLIMGLWVGPWINPAMTGANPVHFFIGHLAYGMVTGLTLFALVRPNELSQVFSRRTLEA